MGALPLETVWARSAPRPPSSMAGRCPSPTRGGPALCGGAGAAGPGESRPSPRCSGQRRRIRGRAARERREAAGGRGCRCSRRPGGEWRGI
ncbi:hypothetical protein Nmel_016540 [Mimus melanotis]